MTPENYAKINALTAFARKHDHTLNELAHAWLLSQPSVSSVISGATRVEHIQANAVAGEWELSPEEVAAVNEILD